MTIEAQLERIANALERLAAQAMVDTAVDASIPKAAPRRGRPPKAALPAPAPEVDDTPPVSKGKQEDWVDEPPEDPVAVEEESAAAPTKEDVRAALVAYQGKFGAEKARGLLKSVGGVDTLGQLPEAKFTAVIAAAKK